MKARKNIFNLGGSMYPYDIPVGSDMPVTQYDLLLNKQNIDAMKTKDKDKMTNPFMGTPKTLFDLGGDIQMNGADFSSGLVQDNTKVYRPMFMPIERKQNFSDSEYFWDAGKEYPAGLWRHKDGTFHAIGAYGKDIVLTQEEADSIIRANKVKNRKERLQKAMENHKQNPYAGGGRIYSIGQNKYDIGGVLQSHGSDWSTGLVTIGAGGTHEMNPYDGVQLGTDSEGTPNLVEEGEVVYNDYVFSNRLEVPKEAQKWLGVKGKNLTFAEASKQLEKEIKERPNDPVSHAGFEAQMERLEEEQEFIKRCSSYSVGEIYDVESDELSLLTHNGYEYKKLS